MKCCIILLCIVFLRIATYECSSLRKGEIREFDGKNREVMAKRITKRYIDVHDPNKCFPSSGKVNLENGDSVTMSELQTGDRVQTVSPDGRLTYSEVRTFLDKQSDLVGLYKSIATPEKTITLSAKHLIYIKKSTSDKFNPIFADDVSAGDEVLVNDKNELISGNVQHVSTLLMKGAYAPLTMEGNIVVDGVLASCYAGHDHDMSHFAVASISWMPGLIEAVFNVDTDSPGYVGLVDDASALWFDTWATVVSSDLDRTR